MAREQEELELGFNKYLSLIETSILSPDLYATLLKKISLVESIIFLIINSLLLVILSAAIRTFLLDKNYLFFSLLSESLVLLPFVYIAILILGVILFIFAKIFRSRAKFKNNLKAVMLSSILIPFFAVPVFKILAIIITLFILIFCFKVANHFDKVKAFLAVTIPVSIFIYVLIATGIINTNFITR